MIRVTVANLNNTAADGGTMHRLSLLVGIAACAALSSGPTNITGRALGKEPDNPVLAEFDLDAGSHVLKVPVSVGGDQYRFGLATADSSFFSKDFAKKLPPVPPEFNMPAESDENLSSFVVRGAPKASIAALTVRFARPWVMCGHLTSFGAHFLQTDGVIGLDALAQHIVQIDFDNGKLRFLRSVPDDAGDRFEISSLQTRPRTRAVKVKAQCGYEPAEDFYVELENSDAISIRSPLYRRLVDKKQIRHLHDESTFGADRGMLCHVGLARSFSLGRFRATDVRAVVSGDNIIGLGYLARYVVTFDFPNGFMYMRPGMHFGKPDGSDVSGLYAKWQSGRLEVIFCEPGGPADNAGLQQYDVILEVDRQPVSQESRSSFSKQLRQEGRTLRVHFRRGGLHHNVDLKLEAARGKQIDGSDGNSGGSVDDAIPDYEPLLDPPEFELWEPREPERPRNTKHEETRNIQAEATNA